MKYLKEKFYLCGYYIVEPIVIKDWMNKEMLPEMILSASECICDFFPDIYVIESEKHDEEYSKKIMLDKKIYFEMKCWIKNRLGSDLKSPNIFSNYESVAGFCKKFLYNKKNLKIIGIAIPKGERREAFLEDNLNYNMFENVNQKIDIDERGKVLGYEIL